MARCLSILFIYYFYPIYGRRKFQKRLYETAWQGLVVPEVPPRCSTQQPTFSLCMSVLCCMLYCMLVMWRAKQRASCARFLTTQSMINCFNRRGCGDRGKNTCNMDFVCGADEAVLYAKAAVVTLNMLLMIAIFARRFSRTKCNGKIECPAIVAHPRPHRSVDKDHLVSCRLLSIQRNSFSGLRVSYIGMGGNDRVLITRRTIGRKTDNTDTNKSTRK